MKISSYDKTEKMMFFVLLILMFQITRNINLIIYVGLLFLAYFFLYIFLIYESNLREFKDLRISTIELLFVLTLIWLPVITLINTRDLNYFDAIARYVITLPIIIFFIVYKKYSLKIIHSSLRLFVIFMAMASISVPYQILFGPITFFAESSYREGLVRYSSLAGSLTALGTLGSLAVVIVLFSGKHLFSKMGNVLILLSLVIGMMLSFQKAAIVNLIFCIVLLLFFSGIKKMLKSVFLIIVFTVILLSLYRLSENSLLSQYAISLINYTFSETQYGVGNDFMIRLWEKPFEVIQFHDITWIDYISGIGLASLGGIMGQAHMPMAHNNFFDLVFSGGVLHFISYTILLVNVFNLAIKKIINKVKLNYIDKTYLSIITLIIINMSIGAISFYQPISAVIIFFVIATYKKATIFGEKVETNNFNI